MLSSMILVVTVVILVVGFIAWLNTKKTPKKVSTVPGLDPSDPKKGNNDEIAEAGSLHQFLFDLHQKFGSIVSFWMGEEYMVSIASADLFKQHSKCFNRPVPLFKLFEPLITSSSIQYANDTDGKQRRHLYDPMYSHESVTQDHLPIFIQIAEKMMKDFSKIPKDEHVPVEKYMFYFSLKSICQTTFGKSFEDDEEVNNLKKSYDTCWSHMEETIAGVVHDDEDKEAFQEGKNNIMTTIQKVINERRNIKKGTLLIDILLKGDISDDVVVADAITYLVGGSHTTGLMLTWCLFYLADRPIIQEKCFEELVEVLGNETIDARVVNDLKYIRQVLDETLRCAALAPFAARFDDTETELGGHIIPAKTPVIHALGVSSQDGNVWPEPTKFDPDRFKENPPPYSFVPFGFAGQRKCPGYRFSYIEGLVFLSEFLRKFKVKLAPGQEKNVGKVYGLVTKPAEEIFVTLEPR